MSGRSGATATIQTFVVKVFILGVNLGTGVITARVLGSDGRGELAAMTLWPQFLAFAVTFGLPKSLLYNLKNNPRSQSELFATSLLMSGILGLLASAIGVVFIPQWLSQYSPTTIRAAQWFMLSAPLSLIGVVLVAAFEARDEFTKSNQTRYLIPLMTLIGILILIVFGIGTPITFALAYAFPSVPIAIWMVIELWHRYQPRWKNLVGSFKKLMDYGIRSYGIDLLNTLSGNIGQALVVSFLTASSMGLYTVALNLTRPLNTFESAINTVLLPKATARPLPEIISLVGRAVRVSTFLSFLCVVPLMLLGPFLLKLLYGEGFIDAAAPFRILLLEVLFAGTTWMLGQSFMASGRPGLITILQGVGLGITVPMMFLLLPKYKMVGAALALLISTMSRFVFVLICYPLVLKVRPPNILITLDDLLYMKKVFLKRG